MPFYITYESKNHIVLTLIQGNFDKDLLREFFTEMVAVALENDCNRILSDLRVAKINFRHQDIPAMAKELDTLNVPASFKRALVISSDHEDYQFWEKVCHDQGYRYVKIFEDYVQAKVWLLGEHDHPE